MISLISALDVTSLVPSSYQASASLVLQTAVALLAVFLVSKIASFVMYTIKMQKIFGDLPGPKERTWLRGSFSVMPEEPEGRLLKFLYWGNTFSKKSGYVRLWSSMGRPVLMICHPSTMKRILKTAEPKPINLTSGYRMLRDWLGDGLLISGGAKWARNRRLLTPAFHFDILKPYVDVYNKSTDVLINKFDSYSKKGEKFELFQEICGCSLDIILKCAFSSEMDTQSSGNSHPYVVAVRDLSIAVTDRIRYPLRLFDTVYYNTKAGKKYKQDCDYVHSIAEDIIKKRKETLEQTGDIMTGRKYLDFLDILITARDENGEGLSLQDIRNEVDTFLFEGHDTTASAISWILYSLAEHPEYQRKCQQEIDEILEGRDSDDIKWFDLSRFEYLTQCIKEGMRLHAPVAIVSRMTTKDFDIGDRIIPNDTLIIINIWALHHNEDVWGKNHMEFIPDRFSKENLADMDPYQFVPFSGGPRNCIGQHFAMNEMKTTIAKLLYNFDFKLDPDHKVKKQLAAVMRAVNGIMMHVERRRH